MNVGAKPSLFQISIWQLADVMASFLISVSVCSSAKWGQLMFLSCKTVVRINEIIYMYSYIVSVSQFSHSVMSDSLQPHGLQHTRPPCPSPTPGVHPNSCSLSQ